MKSLGEIAHGAFYETLNKVSNEGQTQIPAWKTPPLVPSVANECWEAAAAAIVKQCSGVIRERWEDNITKGEDVMRVHEGTQCELALLDLLRKERPA